MSDILTIVAITSFNRMKYLKSLVNNLRHLPKESYDIIVVDNCSTEKGLQKYVHTDGREQKWYPGKPGEGAKRASRSRLSSGPGAGSIARCAASPFGRGAAASGRARSAPLRCEAPRVRSSQEVPKRSSFWLPTSAVRTARVNVGEWC